MIQYVDSSSANSDWWATDHAQRDPDQRQRRDDEER